MIFFWGFRTHAVVTKEGICLIEKTLPNNITDQDAAFSLIRELKRKYHFKKVLSSSPIKHTMSESFTLSLLNK